MAWFADLAGKAENLLNNIDEQTGVALRSHHALKQKKQNDAIHPTPLWQKKRPIPKNVKKIDPVTDNRSTYAPSRKSSPTSHQSLKATKEVQNRTHPSKRSPVRKANPVYNLHNSPKTLVGDVVENDMMDQIEYRQRRYSLPEDFELINTKDWTYKMQNLEVENVMLKNELNVMNKEVADLLDRLRKTEDGNSVVNGIKELSQTSMKLANIELFSQRVQTEKNSLTSELEQLKQKIHELTTVEIIKYKFQYHSLETEVALLRDRNLELEIKIKELHDRANEKETIEIKLENELRHAQTTINDLQSNIDKANAECQRVEKDWEAYKLRVKSMLFAKDNEIKSLQEGMNIAEDALLLKEQLETLKEEKEVLSESISQMNNECIDMKHYVTQLESKHDSAERVVTALRDALRDERAARNRAEAQCMAFGKELKAFQIESGQTVASLRTALRDKEEELNNLINTTSSSIHTTDTSALNVADYDVMQDVIDNEKIQYLSKTLVQRQQKIDSLLADNNMLRIQLEKLESKYKTEVSALKANFNHSVVQFQDGDSRMRSRTNNSLTSCSFLLRIALMIKRYPLFRLFFFIYLVCLHLWVFTVTLTSTPDNYAFNPTKS